ncbi:hypothetical protein GW17_00040816 [Ensete ventricosum]|nr:hypothetical protein GW17_00040816 [Ensete ventricosum]
MVFVGYSGPLIEMVKGIVFRASYALASPIDFAQTWVEQIEVFTDYQLVVVQVSGNYEAREPIMIKYMIEVRRLASTFKHFAISRIPRVDNSRVDALAKLAST